ncbi:DUF397 domain-containing protein [Actinomadura sp. KC06]|uniref:DUF397 domain-containing protein n=1 Tax=Actinomadura sp. KC06 TaxID=2530369 RepID=UPI00104F860C|nr:DUF397 domain-containing protein [Actinomadura sp. KC06]TDD27208.1 DUF397 domain-containing protein [Actinomadura sp. KC06]
MGLSKEEWRKASRSTVQNDNCVEVAGTPKIVAFRDSKDPDGPKLIISISDFQHFTNVLKRLYFDMLITPAES